MAAAGKRQGKWLKESMRDRPDAKVTAGDRPAGGGKKAVRAKSTKKSSRPAKSK